MKFKDLCLIISEISSIEYDKIEKSDKLVSLGFDSLKLVELIIRIETYYNIVFNDDDIIMSRWDDVQSVMALITAYEARK